MPIPKGVFQLGMRDEKFTRRCSFQNAHDIGDRERRRKAQEEVDVVRLNFLGKNNVVPIRTDFIQKSSQRTSDIARQNASSVFWTPDHMVCRLVNAVSSVCNLNHVCNCTSWWLISEGAQGRAIPLATEVASFLARFL